MNLFAYYRSLRRERDELLAGVREIRSTVRRLETKLMAHDEALAALQGGITELAADVTADETLVADLRKAVADLTAKVGTIPADDTAALEEAGAQIAALDARIKALTTPPSDASA